MSLLSKLLGPLQRKAKKEISVHGVERLVKREIKDLAGELQLRLRELPLADLLALLAGVQGEIARIRGIGVVHGVQPT
jgi:hypothetical protein